MPEITDSQYQEYMGLQSENKVLKEAADNTATWLKAGRDEIKTLKETVTWLETTITEKDTEITTKVDELATKETELTEAKELWTKWTDHETATADALTANIDKLKTDLWDKFTDAHKEFIDGLDNSKVETYLKWLNPEGKWTPPPSTDDWKGWNPAWGSDPSAFDKAAWEWNLDGMMDALNTSMSTE